MREYRKPSSFGTPPLRLPGVTSSHDPLAAPHGPMQPPCWRTARVAATANGHNQPGDHWRHHAPRAHERRAHPERVPVSQIVSSRSPTGEGTAPDRWGPRHQSGRNTARAVEVQEDVTMETAGSNYVANVNLAWWLGGWMRALRRRARSRRRAGASCIVLAVGEQVGVGVDGLIGAPKSVDVGGDLLE